MKDRVTIWPRIVEINDSSNLDFICYDPDNHEMKVVFLAKGSVASSAYLYFGVKASDFGNIVASDSAGKKFQSLLNISKWPVEKLDES